MKPVDQTSRAYVLLHIAVILWGVTAILGKLISFNEYVLVWYRMAIVSLSFLLFARTWRGLREIGRRSALKIGAVGILVSIHWIFFYGAIKYANVSVTLSVMATISFMASFTEPLITGRKFQWYESLLGLLIIPGIYLIFYFTEAGYTTGIIMAFISAFFAALFTSFNKKYVHLTNPFSFSFIQLTTGFIFLSIFLPVYLVYFPDAWYIGSTADYGYLFLLAFFCTTIPYIIVMVALRNISAFVLNLTNNLEPVYGIILSWIIFAENKEMDWRFYIGSAIIIFSIFLQPLLKRRFERD
jgi:drug/metabolite transporter (DMT)-like permease